MSNKTKTENAAGRVVETKKTKIGETPPDRHHLDSD